jgi:succinate dehydrogenase / fumarate reductase flavoprotein subunit
MRRKGDYRARESNVHRLAEVSANIIDQCVSGVPLAREYGGLLTIVLLENFVSRTFLCKVKQDNNC